MEHADLTNDSETKGVRWEAALPPTCYLGRVSTTVEALKVCLDDDSSLEDGDEDMFDDDAFAFGDEDFAALMSHEALQRMVPSHPRSLALAAAPASHPPLHDSASIVSEHAAGSNSSPQGVDSPPSTAASSIASLGTLTTSSSSISKKMRTKRRVSLHNDVAVVPIPMRTEYSLQVRERLWSPASELHQNAMRNTLEFAAEGFQWRNATDDAQMVIVNGERVHPIHYLNLCRGRTASACGAENRPRQATAVSPPISMDTEPS